LSVSALWLICAMTAAALSLDRVLIGQWMLSRPAVLGPCLGAALGDTATGWWVGLLFEAMSLDASPVGGVIGMNGTIAAASALLAALGPVPLPLAAAFPLGIGFGFLVRPLEERLRLRREVWTRRVADSLREGRDIAWARAIGTSLAEEFAALSLLLTVGVGLAAGAAGAVWNVAPETVRAAFSDALALAPLAASASLMFRLARKR